MPSDTPSLNVEEPLTPQQIVEYAVWFARKVKGPRADVARSLLEQDPWLREPLEAATLDRERQDYDRLRAALEALERWDPCIGAGCWPPMQASPRGGFLVRRDVLAALANVSPAPAGLQQDVEQAIAAVLALPSFGQTDRVNRDEVVKALRAATRPAGGPCFCHPGTLNCPDRERQDPVPAGPQMVPHDHAALGCEYPCKVVAGTMEPRR
jgi:hypothetical protein